MDKCRKIAATTGTTRKSLDEIEVLLCKFVFTNKDGSTGEMYLVSNDLKLSAENFQTLYKKRWSVEEYHKSLKQNASLAKSPTRTVRTQICFFVGLCLALAQHKCEIGKNEICTQVESFRAKIKIVPGCNKDGVETIRKFQNDKCVT